MRIVHLLCIAFAAAGVSVLAEGTWLIDVPKAERAKISSAFSSLGAVQKKIRDDHAGAVRHEAQYAKKARFLARSLDIAAVSVSADEEKRKNLLELLTDQRRLRFESSLELSEGRYGRTGTAGFESAAALGTKLSADGGSFSAKLEKLLPKMRRPALASLISDFEARVAAHPDCPAATFAELKAAAAGLGPTDRRRWALALASGLPDALPAAFPERLKAERGDGQAAATPEALFFQVLDRFKMILETAAYMKAVLPAAAAASWYVDSLYAPIPPRAAAAVAAFTQTLSAANPEAVARATAEFPLLDEALSEYASIVWLVRRTNAEAFYVDFGAELRTVEDALRTVWRAKTGTASPAEFDAAPKAPAIRAAERMSMFLEGNPSNPEILSAFSELRTDAQALRAFADGVRYEAARSRVAEALAVAIVAAEQAAGAVSSIPVHFLVSGASPFGPIIISAVSTDGRIVAPRLFATEFAASLAASFGHRVGEETAPAAWLTTRGVFFSIPCLARSSIPSPEELDALADGSSFYPPLAARRGTEIAVSGLVLRLMAADAARIGLPFRFVASQNDLSRRVAVFSSGAGRYAEQRRPRISE